MAIPALSLLQALCLHSRRQGQLWCLQSKGLVEWVGLGGPVSTPPHLQGGPPEPACCAIRNVGLPNFQEKPEVCIFTWKSLGF